MGLFGLSKKEIDKFTDDCSRTFYETAVRLGVISGKKIVINEEILSCGSATIDFVLSHYDPNHFGYSDMCEACAIYALQIGVVFAAKERDDGLSNEYFREVLSDSPREAGYEYLSMVGMDDEYHPLYEELVEDLRKLYKNYQAKDSKKVCMKNAMLVIYAIGSTMSLEH